MYLFIYKSALYITNWKCMYT